MRIPHKNSIMNGWFVIDGCRQVKGGSVGGILLFSRFGIRQNPIPVNESDLFFFHHEGHEEHEGIREKKDEPGSSTSQEIDFSQDFYPIPPVAGFQSCTLHVLHVLHGEITLCHVSGALLRAGMSRPFRPETHAASPSTLM